MLHDLRRTARSLMARAGVRPDIAERVWATRSAASKAFTIDTAIDAEKAAALAALAELIQVIVRNDA